MWNFRLKNFMKIGKVVESCGERDFQNGGVSLFKQFYSLFQSKRLLRYSTTVMFMCFLKKRIK